MKLTDAQLTFFANKYGMEPAWFNQKNELFTPHGIWQDRLNAFTLGLSHQQAEVDRLREGWQVACAFIDSHVADPDITDEMIQRYAEFNVVRGALTHPPVKEQS